MRYNIPQMQYIPEEKLNIIQLFKTTKYETIYRNDYSTSKEAKKILINFFDCYNNRRLHQSLEYKISREVYYIVYHKIDYYSTSAS